MINFVITFAKLTAIVNFFTSLALFVLILCHILISITGIEYHTILPFKDLVVYFILTAITFFMLVTSLSTYEA